MTASGTESFVLFDEPVRITTGKFFISYKISGSVSFCVYSAGFSGSNRQNTAWVKDPSRGWIMADTYSPSPAVKTSLAIQPLVRSTSADSLPQIPVEAAEPFFFDRTSRILSLRKYADETVPVFIYSLTGALMEKGQINETEKSLTLAEKSKGTIAIIQLILSNKIYSKKIIY